MFARIVTAPDILSGKPRTRGTRLSVEFLLELIASRATREEIVTSYPQLMPEDIDQAMQYAAYVLKSSSVIQTRAAG